MFLLSKLPGSLLSKQQFLEPVGLQATQVWSSVHKISWRNWRYLNRFKGKMTIPYSRKLDEIVSKSWFKSQAEKLQTQQDWRLGGGPSAMISSCHTWVMRASTFCYQLLWHQPLRHQKGAWKRAFCMAYRKTISMYLYWHVFMVTWMKMDENGITILPWLMIDDDCQDPLPSI